MNNLIEFLKAKSLQIAITSVSVCLVIGVSAGAVIHSNNKKLETILNELSSSSTTENVTESSSETTTESTTESSTNVSTTVKKKTPNTTTTTTEPAGDRTIQYLAEYERITNEYENKRIKLEEYTVYETVIWIDDNASEEEKVSINERNSSANSHNEKVKDSLQKIKELDEQYEKDIEALKKNMAL